MSKNTVNQTNYQIVQTGGKLDMSNQGVAAMQAALGYPGAKNHLEKLFLRSFHRERLEAIRNKYKAQVKKINAKK